MTRAYIGIGSNLDRPLEHVRNAIGDIAAIDGAQLVEQSSFYGSEPMGPQDQPDFVNAVVLVETELTAEQLLMELFAIEDAHGRERMRHWGPRTLDLDLLIYAERQSQDDVLTLPHPGIAERAFVLVPLLEITPDLVIPGIGPAADCAQSIDRGRLQLLESR